MTEPLVSELARISLLRIAAAWDAPPGRLSLSPGPWEMAHHFLRDELHLPYQEIGHTLHAGTYKTVIKYVGRGQLWYETWPAYSHRYDDVKESIAAQLNGVVPLRSSRRGVDKSG